MALRMAFTFGCHPQWVAQRIQSVGCHADTTLIDMLKTPKVSVPRCWPPALIQCRYHLNRWLTTQFEHHTRYWLTDGKFTWCKTCDSQTFRYYVNPAMLLLCRRVAAQWCEGHDQCGYGNSPHNYPIKLHLHRAMANVKAIFFFDFLSLFNLNIKLDFLLTHLQWCSLCFHFCDSIHKPFKVCSHCDSVFLFVTDTICVHVYGRHSAATLQLQLLELASVNVNDPVWQHSLVTMEPIHCVR